MPRKPSKKAIDRAVNEAFYRHAEGAVISVFDLSKIHAAGRAAIEAGTDLDGAIKAAIERYRVPPGGDEGCTLKVVRP